MLNLTTGKIIGIAGGIVGTTAIGAGTAYLTSPSKPATKEDTSNKKSKDNTLPKTQTVTKDKLISSLLNKKNY